MKAIAFVEQFVRQLSTSEAYLNLLALAPSIHETDSTTGRDL